MGLMENYLPEEHLPQCWSDDRRMNALFAPFRIKSANPESWEMKMKFWTDMLRMWCKYKKDPIVSPSDAKFAFQRNGRTPSCIDIVFEELYRIGDLSPVSKYQQILHNGPEGWVKWGARLAFKPAVFAITAVTSLLPARQTLDTDGLPKASIESDQTFVLESAVKEQALHLLESYPAGEDRLGSIDELMRNNGWTGTREAFEVLLGFLVSQGYALKKDEVVKLAEPNKQVSPVTEADEALARLTSAESRLEDDNARLLREVAAAEDEARTAMRLGNRLAAKAHLKKKHKLQQRIAKCEASLENVRQMSNQMRQVNMNVSIVNTYKVGTDAMKQVMKTGGLELDSVDDTMDDLKEVMENYSEVEKALNRTVDDFDAAELEEELKDLLAGPSGGDGGTQVIENGQTLVLPSPPKAKDKDRSVPERDFVFDGEERVLAELNNLSVQDADQKHVQRRQEKVLVAETCTVEEKREVKVKPSKSWYPHEENALRPSDDEVWSNNNVDTSLSRLTENYAEVRLDERLHPGQRLNVDFTKPPALYNTDFQVRDHNMADGVWIYNTKDHNKNTRNSFTEGLADSTEYFSAEISSKGDGTHFQMAPGGERRRQHKEDEACDSIADIERRLKDLKGYKS